MAEKFCTLACSVRVLVHHGILRRGQRRNFLCGLCVQGIAAQKRIRLCLLWCGWRGSSAVSGQRCQLSLCPLPSCSAWLGALQRARWPRLSSPRCEPWALRRAASTGVTACVGASAWPWERCVPVWKRGIFSLESLGGGGKAVAGSGDGEGCAVVWCCVEAAGLDVPSEPG